MLGESPINSMEDNTSYVARICREFFDTSLRSVLEEGQWPFATIEEPAQRIFVEDYTKEQKFVYRIPANSAIVLGLYKRYDRKNANKHIDWDIRYIPELKTSAIICNRRSFTNEDIENDIYQDNQILIEYVNAEQTTYSYSASFVRCLVAQLAADLAMPITHDPQKMQLMVGYAEEAKAKALRNALNEDKQDKLHWVDEFTASREGRIC